MSFLRTALIFVVFLVIGTSSYGCKARKDSSLVKTDLGPSGNQAVARRFNSYIAAREQQQLGCRATTQHPKVLVSGFGLFVGVDYNISGLVTQTFADPAFTPATLRLDGTDRFGTRVSNGNLQASNNGARATVRVMQLGGRDVEVCFLVLDVIWDLAASIIVYEAERFQPTMIFMSGRGASGAIFEGGAVNDATIGLEGFDSSGREIANNRPHSSAILPNGPASVPMTWHNEIMFNATQLQVSRLGFDANFEDNARQSNNYICNNVSYVVLNALAGRQVYLAGGQVNWQPRFTQRSTAGFFHYPMTATSNPREVADWIRIVGTAIVSNLRAMGL